jgi:uncharacterized protein (DUF952 family)
MRVFHVASASDWQQAQQTGAYTTSSRGRAWEEEGFLHACRADQVARVFDRYYRDADEPLVLLTIETDQLEVPWQEDRVGDDTFPHMHGPLSPQAVVAVAPLDDGGCQGPGARTGSPGRGRVEDVRTHPSSAPGTALS